MTEKCIVCKSTDDIADGLCVGCYENMPVDEWITAEHLTHKGDK